VSADLGMENSSGISDHQVYYLEQKDPKTHFFQWWKQFNSFNWNENKPKKNWIYRIYSCTKWETWDVWKQFAKFSILSQPFS